MLIKYLPVAFIAFFCESIDSSLGMGYGTILTPILLFMGYQPIEIVPLILFSEFISGLTSAFMHHRTGNVNLKPGSKSFHTALILACCSIIGTVAATFLAISIPEIAVKAYISFLLIIIGITTYISINRTYKFSWYKIIFLGLLASFNKGISGGGYGPVVTGGQVLSGLKSKNAVGITSFAEGLTCLVGVISYFFLIPEPPNFQLGLALLGGAICSIPISVNIVKQINEKAFKKVLSISIITMGLFTFCKTFTNLISFNNLPLIIVTILVTIPFAYHLGQKKINKEKLGTFRNEHEML